MGKAWVDNSEISVEEREKQRGKRLKQGVGKSVESLTREIEEKCLSLAGKIATEITQ